MTGRQRLSASIEGDLIAAARAAVAEGRAENVSAWVNLALRSYVEHEKRLSALDAFIASYEAEHGVITDDEMRLAARDARARAVVVRGRGAPRSATRRKRGAA
jgi:hypothetical protein